MWLPVSVLVIKQGLFLKFQLCLLTQKDRIPLQSFFSSPHVKQTGADFLLILYPPVYYCCWLLSFGTIHCSLSWPDCGKELSKHVSRLPNTHTLPEQARGNPQSNAKHVDHNGMLVAHAKSTREGTHFTDLGEKKENINSNHGFKLVFQIVFVVTVILGHGAVCSHCNI